MSNDAHLKMFAHAAFSNHIPPHFATRRLERDLSIANITAFDWAVEYPDGKQFGGSVQMNEKGGGYSVCISMQYDPENKWSWPHTWHHGFIEAACPNS